MSIMKPLVNTQVFIIGQGSVMVFEDAVDNGNVTRDGTIAREQLLKGKEIAAKTTSDEYVVIPYHAVNYATIGVDASEPIEEPADAFCE